jgi:hypothetical protein
MAYTSPPRSVSKLQHNFFVAQAVGVLPTAIIEPPPALMHPAVPGVGRPCRRAVAVAAVVATLSVAESLDVEDALRTRVCRAGLVSATR